MYCSRHHCFGCACTVAGTGIAWAIGTACAIGTAWAIGTGWAVGTATFTVTAGFISTCGTLVGGALRARIFFLTATQMQAQMHMSTMTTPIEGTGHIYG